MKRLIPIIIIIIMPLFLPRLSPAEAATYSLTPSSANLNPGDPLAVTLNVDATADAVNLAAVAVRYDDAVLQYVKVDRGSFLPLLAFPNNLPGGAGSILRFAATIDASNLPAGLPKSGQGTLAVIHFTAKNPGTTALALICSGDPGHSQIVNSANTNVLTNCPQGSFTVAGVVTAPAGATATPTLSWTTPIPVPTGPAQTCDICGKCVGQQPPPEWDRCMQCVQKGDYKWTALGCLPTSPGGFTQAALRVLIFLVGGIAFLALLYGGFVLLSSRGNPDRLEQGKGVLLKAITGLLLTLFAVFILKFIGVEILTLPGFS